jgi:murein DD-endopeptidase MepM/ murein hydrolase activator NlpD
MTTLLERSTESSSTAADSSARSTQAASAQPANILSGSIANGIAWIVTQLWTATTAGLTTRYAAHITVLAVIIAAALMSHPAQASNQVASVNQLNEARSGSADQTLLQTFAERGLLADSNVVSRLPSAHTTIPVRIRREIEIYKVQPGDNVQSIAAAYGLKPETILWSNPAIEDQPDLLKIDQEIVILPIDGAYHEVKQGDTLASIAKFYKVDIANITDVQWNNLQPPDYTITPGMKLIVKDGVKPYVPKVVTSYTGPIPAGAHGTGQFRWPVIGYITQDYWSGHRAIDIAVPLNTAVYAADSGLVTFAGWTDVGYGFLVRINHGNGFETLYAHNTTIVVSVGQQVERGQLIAYSGSTGHSTGPHVHFEIRLNDIPVNPRIYLP